MKFCTNCGAQLLDAAKFCIVCGQRIEQVVPAAQTPAAVTPAKVHAYDQPENHSFSEPVVPETEQAVPNAQTPVAVAPAEVHVYGQPVNHSFSKPTVPKMEQGVVHTYGAPVNHSFAPPVQAESALSGTYSATCADPVVTSPAAPPAPDYKPAPAPEQPAEATGAYTAPVAVEKKTAKPALPKLNLNSKMIRIGLIAVLAVALIVGLISCIAGGGGNSSDPTLGIYNGVSCSYSGFEMSAEGEWIELKSGGKLKMNLMGEEYSGKWELDGEDLTVTQAGDTFYGTLRNGTLVLDLSGVIYTYKKEVTDTSAPSAPEAGYWALKYSEGDESMAMDEETVAMLAEMGIVIYIDLKEDGTGIFMMEEAMPITWSNGKIVADDGSEVLYTLENGELIVDIQDALMHFVPGKKSAETENPSSGDLSDSEITYYMAVSGNLNGKELNDSAIAQMGGIDLTLNGDGTGTMNMFGQSEEISYDNNVIYFSGMPMEYEMDGDYLYLKMSDAVEFTLMVEIKGLNRPKDELTPNDLMYWKGDYYGWWVFDNVIEGNADAQGNWWDCCMTLDIFSDGTGYITIWDEEYGKDDPIAQVAVSVSVTNGVARIVSESGEFMGCEVAHADWLFYSDSTGYEDTLGFSAMYEAPDIKIDCYFFMRQWGTIWDDVEEEDLPGYYESWYLPLIKDGEVVAPKTIG